MAHVRSLDIQHQAAAMSWISKTMGDQIELRLWNVDHIMDFDTRYASGEIIGAVVEGNAELTIGKNESTTPISKNQSFFLPYGTFYKWTVKTVPFKAVLAMPKGEQFYNS